MASPMSQHDGGSPSWTSASKSWPMSRWLSQLVNHQDIPPYRGQSFNCSTG